MEKKQKYTVITEEIYHDFAVKFGPEIYDLLRDRAREIAAGEPIDNKAVRRDLVNLLIDYIQEEGALPNIKISSVVNTAATIVTKFLAVMVSPEETLKHSMDNMSDEEKENLKAFAAKREAYIKQREQQQNQQKKGQH